MCNCIMILILLCLLGVSKAQNLQVTTTEGSVEGNRAPDGNYHAFYGIPYAGPTDGENRFKAPTLPSPYPGLFHAMDSNIICAQPSERGLIGVENCLTLNIFTNNVTTLKPVLVWLNAEEYTTTSTQPVSFKRFIEEGIVVVTINFRLSIFGFLCLGIPEAPGNVGIKDVVQGLKWINTNIAGFGGNPNNVVLMGHSSAAAMVDIITYLPEANNLVHKAVALSGSALAPWAVAYDPIGYAHMFAEKLSYTTKDKSQLANLLMTTDLNILGPALNGFKFFNNTPLFAPCIEDAKLNNSVLTDAPLNILRSGNYNHVPYIAGYVNKEGTMRAAEAVFDGWLEKMQANFTDFLPVDLDFGSNKTRLANTIRNFYFTGSPISMSTINDYLAYHGDTLVVVSVIRSVMERTATSTSEVRLFEFGFIGTYNSDWTLNQIPLDGVKHGGILNYLFDFDLKPTEQNVMKSVVKRFSSFAYTGNPTPLTFNQWYPSSKDTVFFLFYGGSANVSPQGNAVYTETVEIHPHAIRMILWNELYSNYYRVPLLSSTSNLVSMFWAVVLCAISVRFF